MKRTVIIVIGLILTAVLMMLTLAARKHRWYSNQSNTYGWEIMTAEEQREYHLKMQNLRTYDECTVHMADHKKKMDDRARDKGIILPAIQVNPCEIMKNRRMYK